MEATTPTTTPNRRPLKWTANSPEGYHIYTYYCDCGWGLEAARLDTNHWTLDPNQYDDDDLSADWNNRSYENYAAMQNDAQAKIENHSHKCNSCWLIYSRPQPQHDHNNQ